MIPVRPTWVEKKDINILTIDKDSNAYQAPREKDALAVQITATDRQIDSLVYQLYGLTPEKIALVEGSA